MALEDAILKFVPAGVENVEKGFVSGWASAPVIDRSRDLILGTAVDTSFYRPNPVVLWCHNRTGLPIARSETPGGGFGLKTKEFQANGLDGLWHDTRFNLDDEFAAKVYGCYQSGFLKGWSMGFVPTSPITRIPHEITKRLNDTAPAKFFPSVKLFEYSAVPIPDNQLALSDARFKALGVPADLMPLVERWTPSQTTFAARYPVTTGIRDTVDVPMDSLPEFTGQLVTKAAKKGGGGHWVTVNGHHVYIGKGGTIHPGGPNTAETSHDDAHKAASEGKATKSEPKGRKLVEGKEHKGAANAANRRGEQAIREASEARKAGDHEKARQLRAAAYGHFKAAQHHDDGNHLQAAAATKTAHEFASGKRQMPKEKSFPATVPQSPVSREVLKMEELVTLTPAEPVTKTADPLQELRDRIDAMPSLIEKSIQSAVSDAVGVILEESKKATKSQEANLLAATETLLPFIQKRPV